jgi:uncharacterized membrane-anchored protein
MHPLRSGRDEYVFLAKREGTDEIYKLVHRTDIPELFPRFSSDSNPEMLGKR